jgi:hypothetical protein
MWVLPTGQDEEEETQQGTIANKQDNRSDATKPNSKDPVEQRKNKHENRTRSSIDEHPPLPSIIFAAKQVVGEQNSCSCTGHNHEPVAKEEKAEHKVQLVEPDAVHNEVQFDEDGKEWKTSNQEHRGNGPKVVDAWWNLPRNLICSDWCWEWLFRLV